MQPIGVVNSILAVVPTFSATLTAQPGGAPIAGQSVAFSLSNNPKNTICTGTGTAAGVASCKPLLALVSILLRSSYTASHAGNTSYNPSTTTEPVILLSLHADASVN